MVTGDVLLHDSSADEARSTLAGMFPGLEPVWLGASRHADRRVDVFLDAAGDRSHKILSLAIDSVLVPETVSDRAHIPYDSDLVDQRPPRSDSVGVFVLVEPIYSSASRARFIQEGAIREADVVAGYAVLATWDTPWLLTERQPKPIALLIDGEWTQTVSTVVAATPADFGACYVRHKTIGAVEGDWAASSFYDGPTYGERIAMVESVLDTPDASDFALGCLAAGPIEDLIGHCFLDYVMRDARTRDRYVPLLRQTYWDREPQDIQDRMRFILGERPG